MRARFTRNFISVRVDLHAAQADLLVVPVLAALARDVSQSAAKFVPDEASTARLADVIRRDLQDKSKPYVAAGFAATRALTRDGAFEDQELVKALDAIFADGAAGAAVRVKAFAPVH